MSWIAVLCCSYINPLAGNRLLYCFRITLPNTGLSKNSRKLEFHWKRRKGVKWYCNSMRKGIFPASFTPPKLFFRANPFALEAFPLLPIKLAPYYPASLRLNVTTSQLIVWSSVIPSPLEHELQFTVIYGCDWASQVAQWVKNLPAMQEMWVWKDPLKEGRRPTPVFSPGESHEQSSLACYSP